MQKITIGVTGFVSKRGEIYISPLAELKALEELTIRGCNVRDVALVPSNLQRLELHNCEAENIDGLVKSEQLKKLKLSSMKITTLEVPLGIQNLELTQCQEIRDFNVLPNLVELKELHLSASRLEDLSLVPYDSLKKLTLDYSQIKEYSGLAKLTKLEWLKLSISDATDLPHLPLTIKHLELSGYQVTNFSSLASLTKLRFLSLGNLKIDDLSLIPSSVETLIISDCTNAKDFTPLNNLLELKNLKLGIPEYEEPKLDISGTSTEHRNLNSLSKLLMLKTLTLTGGTAINGLSELPDSLESLMLRGTKWGGGYTRLTNFSNITEPPNLKKLILNGINNLPPLPTSLTELEMWDGFEDTESLASLANAQKLERLVLVRVDIKDLSVLPKSLKELTLAQCEHIEFCPKWLKEKIRKGEIIIKNHDIKSLLIKPSPTPK